VYEINSLQIDKGADFDETFKIYNEDGTVLELNSSFSGKSKISKYPTSPISFPFNVLLDTENNEVNISMAATVTDTLPFSNRCYFDVVLTYGYVTPTTKKVLRGTILVNDTVS
jgi:hypothetical protein